MHKYKNTLPTNPSIIQENNDAPVASGEETSMSTIAMSFLIYGLILRYLHNHNATLDIDKKTIVENVVSSSSQTTKIHLSSLVMDFVNKSDSAVSCSTRLEQTFLQLSFCSWVWFFMSPFFSCLIHNVKLVLLFTRTAKTWMHRRRSSHIISIIFMNCPPLIAVTSQLGRSASTTSSQPSVNIL